MSSPLLLQVLIPYDESGLSVIQPPWQASSGARSDQLALVNYSHNSDNRNIWNADVSFKRV
jgi:hypothetical protein